MDVDPNLKEIKYGESFGTIEAVKTVSELFGPCSGKITQINKDLGDNPELVNSDSYGKGWMIKIEISNKSELNNLLDSEAYKKLIGH